MSYKRVLPRDLFNEAKLLKCLGQLALHIHDERIQGLTVSHEDVDDTEGFHIWQDPGSGDISVCNLYFFDANLAEVYVFTPLNAKGNYPLVIEYKGEAYYPFNEKGEYMLDASLFIGKEV